MKKLDGKFYGEIYKNKDGSKVPDDQWIVFLAKDNAVLPMLAFYYRACIELGANPEQVQGINNLRDRVEMWRADNPELCKVPDTEHNEIFKGQPDVSGKKPIEFSRTELLEIKDEIQSTLESMFIYVGRDLSLEPPENFDLGTGQVLRLQSILNKVKDLKEV